jgi:hypothetical protein
MAKKSKPKKSLKTPKPRLGLAAEAIKSPFTVLTVTVNGGKLPFSIQVGLFKDGKKISVFSFSSSFTHVFDGLDKSSTYDITVGGFNPAGGNTVIELTQQQITLTSISSPSPSTETGKSYRVDFNFTVN